MAGNWLFWPAKIARRNQRLEQPEEPQGEKTMHRGFGHFAEDLAVKQFGLLGNQAHFAQRVIGLYGKRQNLRAADASFRCFDLRHGTNPSASWQVHSSSFWGGPGLQFVLVTFRSARCTCRSRCRTRWPPARQCRDKRSSR